MTIFDSIRYPISFPVMYREFNNLPEKIQLDYYKWADKQETGWRTAVTDKEKYDVIKRLILGYDNDNL